MNLFEITYSKIQQETFSYLKQIGAVIDTAILVPSLNADNVYELNKLAAIKGMEIFSDRLIESFESRNQEISDRMVIGFYEDISPEGQEISFKDFMGEGYDIVHDRLQLFVNYPDLEAEAILIQEGFTYALLSPPYGLRVQIDGALGSNEHLVSKNKSLTKVLKVFLQSVLEIEDGGKTNYFTIYKWSDNWSNYFTVGQDWWGAFFWTVFDRRRNLIIVIGASATD